MLDHGVSPDPLHTEEDSGRWGRGGSDKLVKAQTTVHWSNVILVWSGRSVCLFSSAALQSDHRRSLLILQHSPPPIAFTLEK